jgi:hypothetical protein
MKSLAIILLCVLAAVGYGIVLDEVTGRLCAEYFRIGRPLIYAAHSPTRLGVEWGVLEMWWPGLIFGLPLALVARAGRRPRLTPGSLVTRVGRVLLLMACSALLAGILGFVLEKNNEIHLREPIASRILKPRHPLFMAVLGAHLASYLFGLIGGVALIAVTWKKRRALEPR